jgi:tRNA(adenine34) deaminase
MNLLTEERFNWRCEVVEGVLRDECADLLRRFFRERRQANAARKSSS